MFLQIGHVYSLFNWNVSCESFSQCLRFHPNKFSELCTGQHFSLKSNISIPTAIVALFFCRRPYAVSFAIGTIIVFTLYAMRWTWSLSHISDKFFKVTPFNFYSSASIVFERWISGIITSTLHIGKNKSFRPTALAVRRRLVNGIFSTPTPATSSIAISQMGGVYDCLISATALAKPSSAILTRRFTHYGQSAELLSWENIIYNAWHVVQSTPYNAYK